MSTPTFSLQLDEESLQLLHSVAERMQVSAEDFASDILRSHLKAYQQNGHSSEQSKRLAPRRRVNIPGAVSVPSLTNEITYRPALVKNISLGGIGIEVAINSEAMAKSLSNMRAFEILFALPDTQELLSFECTVTHVAINGYCRFGGAFLTHTESSLSRLMNLLATPCPSEKGNSASCR